MKTSRFVRILLPIITVTGIILFGLFVHSCEKELIIPNQSDSAASANQKTLPRKENICGEIYQKPLYFETSYAEAGHALIYNDNTYYYIELNAWNGYLIANTYVFIGTLRSKLPIDKFGNPDLSLYQYTVKEKPWSIQRKFRIPLSDITGHSIQSIAVELKKPKEESIATDNANAWVDGHLFGSSVRGRYFGYDKQICRTIHELSVPE